MSAYNLMPCSESRHRAWACVWRSNESWWYWRLGNLFFWDDLKRGILLELTPFLKDSCSANAANPSCAPQRLTEGPHFHQMRPFGSTWHKLWHKARARHRAGHLEARSLMSLKCHRSCLVLLEPLAALRREYGFLVCVRLARWDQRDEEFGNDGFGRIASPGNWSSSLNIEATQEKWVIEENQMIKRRWWKSLFNLSIISVIFYNNWTHKNNIKALGLPPRHSFINLLKIRNNWYLV